MIRNEVLDLAGEDHVSNARRTGHSDTGCEMIPVQLPGLRKTSGSEHTVEFGVMVIVIFPHEFGHGVKLLSQISSECDYQ